MGVNLLSILIPATLPLTNVNDMEKLKTTKQLTPAQKRFMQRFIDIAYENMAIEKERPFSRRAAYQRYWSEALKLIKDGTYKSVRV